MLGCFLADLQPAMSAQMRGQGVVDGVAAVTFGCKMYDRTFGDECDVRRAGTDIDDRGGPFIRRQDAGAKCGRQALFHHKDLADTGLVSRVEQCPLLDMRNVRHHAHHGLQRNIRSAGFCLFDEMGKHLFGTFKVRNHAAGERRLDDHVTAFATGQLGGFESESDDLFGQFVDGDQRRFVQHNAAALDGNDSAGRTEIDRHRIGNELFQG